jgi:LytS/YehU family sensor histidine kinase
MIPTMMIQPLVENAINHGMDLRKNQKGLLEITFEKINTSQLKITIFDNGEGFEINEIEKIKANHAIDIINERLELINKTTKKELNYLTFHKTEKGFESIIILPTTFF